ncbi:MAG TPA: prepilin peptidase [Planctomycetaceae bacterium]|nr:prepilin peptidase [Planctomycetaceae bacterium]
MQLQNQPDKPDVRPIVHSPVHGWIAIIVLLVGSVAFVVRGVSSEVGWNADWKSEVSPTIQTKSVQVVVTLWIGFLGACFGSFLNVVIYRVPIGRTISGHSGCPRCGHAIRPQHNVPLIGWLFLQGKCYDCQLPIAVRYPTVEAFIASLFLVIAFGEVYPGGINLPYFPTPTYAGVVGIVLDPQWDLLAIASLHAAVLTVLVSWAFILYDGFPVPRVYACSTIVLVTVLTYLFPQLIPIPEEMDSPAILTYRILSGIFIGWLSWYAGSVRGRREPRRGTIGIIFGYLLIALTFGVSSIVSIYLLEGLLRSVFYWLDSRGRLPWGIALCLAALLHLVLWQSLEFSSWWPNRGSSVRLVLAIIAAQTLNTAAVRRRKLSE